MREGGKLAPGTPGFGRASLALFFAGVAVFAMLYGVQPLLPALSREFGLGPAAASLALSATTGTLAVCLVVFGALSDRWGRAPVMTFSLLCSSLVMLLVASAPDFALLVLLRGLQGVCLAGVPAVAVAYLGDEVSRERLGSAVGLYIAGNSVGGLAGRIASGLLAEAFSWRVALAVLGGVSLVAGAAFWRLLPPARNFRPRKVGLVGVGRALLWCLRDGRLLLLYAIGALAMGGFVAVYNYLGYRLQAQPYRLGQAQASGVFLFYLLGTASSALMGRLADGAGRGRALAAGLSLMLCGLAVTVSRGFALILFGVAVFTFGFFGTHSIASGWVSGIAGRMRAYAASLYLLFYYLGSSVGGTAGGSAYARGGWGGLAGMVGGCALCALVCALALRTGRDEAG